MCRSVRRRRSSSCATHRADPRSSWCGVITPSPSWPARTCFPVDAWMRPIGTPPRSGATTADVRRQHSPRRLHPLLPPRVSSSRRLACCWRATVDGPSCHSRVTRIMPRFDALPRRCPRRADDRCESIVEGEGLRLALDALVPFARWVTPPDEVRRFDTWFFLARVPPDSVPRTSTPSRPTAPGSLPPTPWRGQPEARCCCRPRPGPR